MSDKNYKTKKELNSIKALKRKKSVSCRFCYKKFDNRFDLIIHNASHITIPLIKLANLPSQSSKENTVKQDIKENKYDLNMNKIHKYQKSIKNRLNLTEPTSENNYDNLMKPVKCVCKYCKCFFPNKFSLIEHQAVHLYVACALKPQICQHCNRYIPGYRYNLQKHVKKEHRRSVGIRRQLKFLNYIKLRKLNKGG